MDNCIICQLVAGKIPSWRVYEDEHVLCFLPLKIEAYGHTVVAPKVHFADLYSTPPEDLAIVIAATQKLATHYRGTVGAAGVNLLHASGTAAQQSVPHLHFHLIPRFEDDGLNLWPELPRHEVDRDTLLEKLRL